MKVPVPTTRTDLRRSRPVTAYLYPWDIEEHDENLSLLLRSGFERATVAAAYHSVRAATPRDPRRRYVQAETAAFYRPIRAVWEGRSLTPRPAGWVASEDSFGEAVRRLTASGLRVSAWIVLTHNSVLGGARPDFAVRNCFGDVYHHALCPAHAEVRHYAALLAAEAVTDLELEGVSLEAWGQLGALHASHHDKTSAAYSAAAEQILSVCCCDGCQRTWAAEGMSGPEATGSLRRAFHEARISSGPGREFLDDEVAAVLLGCRHAHGDALLEETVGALRAVAPSLRVVAHAQSDPWATGASPGLTGRTRDLVDAVLVPVDPVSPDGAKPVADARAVVARADVAAYVNLLGITGGTDMDETLNGILLADPDELHLYHYGLASDSQLPLFTKLRSTYD